IKEEREKDGPARHAKGFLDLQAFDDLIATAATVSVGNGQNNDDETKIVDPNDPEKKKQPNNKSIGNFSVNSEYYLLEAEAVINQKPVLMRSILYRPSLKDGAANGDVKIKTLSRKLEDPLKRV
ncbi:MAG TPA: hypothetical protein DCL78_00035, partial [Gammaproteobacteria bacterium]|nr:hypothetical protein [Gammaproteobacteria bacterium]